MDPVVNSDLWFQKHWVLSPLELEIGAHGAFQHNSGSINTASV
jgi:hypothetical protein